MKSLQEALRDFKRLDEPEDDQPADDLDLSQDPDQEGDSTDLDAAPDDQSDESDGDDLDLGDDMDFSDPSPSDVDGSNAPWGAVPSSGGGAGGDAEAPADGEADPEAEQEDSQELDAVANQASEDPDRQGLIRTVKGAHLVYKRQGEDGTYEELWIYNVTSLQDEMTIRRAILAGTDIPVNKSQSPDGQQSYSMWSAGNAEMLLITGLQN